MALKVKCDSCKKVINAPEKFAGKKTKCPGCKAPITIPELEPEVVEEEVVEVDPADETVDVPAEKPKKGKGKKIGGKKMGGPKGKSKIGGGPKSKLGKSGSIKKGRGAKPAAASRKRSEEEDSEDDAPAKSNKMLYIIIGAVVLLLAIGAGAYFFFMGGETKAPSPAAAKTSNAPKSNDASKPSAKPAVELTTLDIISAESAGLGGFNIKKLLDIPMVSEELSKDEDKKKIDEFFAGLEDNETTKKLKEEVDRDGAVAAIKKRFDKITFAFDAPEDMSAEKPDLKGVVVLNTAMDSVALMKDVFNMIKDKSGVEELDGDYEGYQFKAADKDGKVEEGIIASIDKKLIVLGTVDQVNTSFELAEDPGSEKSVQGNRELMSKAEGINNSIFWVAFKNPNGAPAEEASSEPAPPAAGMSAPFGAEDVESLLLSIDYENDTLKINLALGFYDLAKVQTSNMMLAGFAPMGLGMMGIPPQQLKVTPEGKVLKATLEVTSEMLEQASEKAAQMGQGAMQITPPPAGEQ